MKITLTIPETEVARLAAAVGDVQRLHREADIYEIRGEIVNHLKRIVRDRERRLALAAMPDPPDLEMEIE